MQGQLSLVSSTGCWGQLGSPGQPGWKPYGQIKPASNARLHVMPKWRNCVLLHAKWNGTSNEPTCISSNNLAKMLRRVLVAKNRTSATLRNLATNSIRSTNLLYNSNASLHCLRVIPKYLAKKTINLLSQKLIFCWIQDTEYAQHNLSSLQFHKINNCITSGFDSFGIRRITKQEIQQQLTSDECHTSDS